MAEGRRRRASPIRGAWTVTQLYYLTGFNYESIWMSPVCYQGYVYTLCGNNGSFLTPPLNCIELATGNLMWTTNNFGMGGLILVNTNLLVLTETGQLVLVQPTPSAYVELARYQAFQFSASAPGKCWNCPSFSNGRVYARSTQGGICLNVSVPTLPALKLLAPQFLNTPNCNWSWARPTAPRLIPTAWRKSKCGPLTRLESRPPCGPS